jgi:pimeloyl-ACP methyl ester carboxylesterase
VSDREWLAAQPSTAARLAAAQALVAEGRGEEICFRADDVDGAAITARRWVSLAAAGGDDDMFSTDLGDEQLHEKLAGLRGVPTLLLLSGADEYVPANADYMGLGKRMQRAIGHSAQLVVMPGGLHNLKGQESEAAQHIAEFIATLPP